MLTCLMIFRDTLPSILVFVNENCCLCACFTEFILLIVSSLSRNFNRFAACFQSYINIACRSTQNAARTYQTLLKITHNKNINIGK